MLQLSRGLFVLLVLALGACAQLPSGPPSDGGSHPPVLDGKVSGMPGGVPTTCRWQER